LKKEELVKTIDYIERTSSNLELYDTKESKQGVKQLW